MRDLDMLFSAKALPVSLCSTSRTLPNVPTPSVGSSIKSPMSIPFAASSSFSHSSCRSRWSRSGPMCRSNAARLIENR